MQYKNTEHKLDAIVSYLNSDKINLAPAFQRGHVWPKRTRQKLVENIIARKPIPAIFIYKDAQGAGYSYNVLDGKQRIESIILFVADQRPDLCVNRWRDYFFDSKAADQGKFTVKHKGKDRTFGQLPDDAVADLKEYSIPTIEITLDDETSLDEIISLFVDINQQGEPVKRFDIAKALYKNDGLLKSTFNIIAIEQRRGKDVHYRLKRRSDIVKVMSRLQAVAAAPGGNAMVDRIWERLLELVLFLRSGKHRSSIDILKGFMGGKKAVEGPVTAAEMAALRRAFSVADQIAESTGAQSKLLTDQTHFYTLIAAALDKKLLDEVGEARFISGATKFARCLEGQTAPKSISKLMDEYQDNAKRQTTHANRRERRALAFAAAVRILAP